MRESQTWLGKLSHLLLMWLPNCLNPHKLKSNLRHPIREVFHTSHKQYRVPKGYVVEHFFFGDLVTMDFIQKADFETGLVPRLKQLLRRDFYYGHCEFFPQAFKLIERKYVMRGGFNYIVFKFLYIDSS